MIKVYQYTVKFVNMCQSLKIRTDLDLKQNETIFDGFDLHSAATQGQRNSGAQITNK